MDRRPGYYFGAEVDGRWWRRAHGDALFARGNGEYWHDDEALYFLRYLTLKPLVIPFRQVSGLSVGRWHAGRWGLGRSVIKVHWRRGEQDLSSGFALARAPEEARRLLGELAERAGFGRRRGRKDFYRNGTARGTMHVNAAPAWRGDGLAGSAGPPGE
jgi:hypothetical protein